MSSEKSSSDVPVVVVLAVLVGVGAIIGAGVAIARGLVICFWEVGSCVPFSTQVNQSSLSGAGVFLHPSVVKYFSGAYKLAD